ncbi:midnolin-like [Siniperca chuatsi]|uniref:midnolin-like n=1 Tax=Siniperca chuatsi TaxID=119488 RepID=UPI001CE0479E|nr:midnolin-like [Siniperca chuatsi]XP_044075365.1 midnolin-like [Siniperca chuatsi]XP_044075366.1 midnolin-like [Siniperca chuatsi]XP_044075368.1 midnolin-like [Siniperca chuatsi]XP_044075369.1 midnolin-like [Siniperca chuatsi]
MEQQQQQQQQQRGLCSFTPGRSACCRAGVSTCQPTMRLSITSTTGSPVELTVPAGETVEGLRTHISQRLRLQTDRIVLLYRDRQLTAGKLLDLGVADGSKLTLVPVIEAGLVCSTARAEKTMMDVLESLTEVEIGDFLSGRSPLTINLGIGAHMMYVQLQLSAQTVAELQQCRHLRAESCSELQTGLPAAIRMSRPDSASAWSSTNTTGSATSPASQTPTPAPDSSDSTSSILFSAQTPRTSFNSTAPISHSSTTASAVNCHHHSPPHPSCPLNSTHTSCPILSTPSLHSGCPPQAAIPVCSPAPTGSIPGPRSPAPASTFKERNVHASSAAELCKQPGAVIESFVSHSPGVFSGTFSGTLAPCSQSSISHPRSGIAIILQILNDLLRTAYHHQGAPPALPHLHCPASNLPASPLLTAEEQSKAKSKTPVTQRAEHLSKTPGEESHPVHSSTQENQALHCKLERLQFLMHQRRLRKRTRRNSHLSQTSHPYQHRHHRP